MDTTVQQQKAMPPPVAPLKKEPPQILYGKLSNFVIEKKVRIYLNFSGFWSLAFIKQILIIDLDILK